MFGCLFGVECFQMEKGIETILKAQLILVYYFDNTNTSKGNFTCQCYGAWKKIRLYSCKFPNDQRFVDTMKQMILKATKLQIIPLSFNQIRFNLNPFLGKNRSSGPFENHINNLIDRVSYILKKHIHYEIQNPKF